MTWILGEEHDHSWVELRQRGGAMGESSSKPVRWSLSWLVTVRQGRWTEEWDLDRGWASSNNATGGQGLQSNWAKSNWSMATRIGWVDWKSLA